MTDYIIDSTPSKELYAPHLCTPSISPYPSSDPVLKAIQKGWPSTGHHSSSPIKVCSLP